MSDVQKDEIGPDGLEQQADIENPKNNPFLGLAQPIIAKIYQGIELPTSLFHYTSSAGLIGIVTEHKLWFSDAAFMNDGSESTYGVRVAAAAIDEFMVGKTVAERAAGDELKDQIADAATHFQQIIFCLSARNNLLNQWRDYGKDVVPYCIELDVTELERWRERANNFPIFITKVVYDVEMQRALLLELVAGLYDRAIALLGSRGQFDEQESSQFLIGAALEVISLTTRFKNPAFEAEEEWRAICYRPDIEGKVPRKYRSSSLGAVPYYEWYRTADDRSLPIRSVTVGPSPYAQVSDLALKQLLGDNGYNVPTHYSIIPIRR